VPQGGAPERVGDERHEVAKAGPSAHAEPQQKGLDDGIGRPHLQSEHQTKAVEIVRQQTRGQEPEERVRRVFEHHIAVHERAVQERLCARHEDRQIASGAADRQATEHG